MPLERMRRFRNNSCAKIPNATARRCEEFLVKRRGWIDAPPEGAAAAYIGEDVQDLLHLYAQPTPRDREKLYTVGQVPLD